MELVWKALIGEEQGEDDKNGDKQSEGLDEGGTNRKERHSSLNLDRFRCQQLLLRAMLQSRCTASSSTSSSLHDHLNDHDDATMIADDEVNIMHMVNATYHPSMAFALSTPVSEGDQPLFTAIYTDYFCTLDHLRHSCDFIVYLCFTLLSSH